MYLKKIKNYQFVNTLHLFRGDEVKSLLDLGYCWNYTFGLHFRESQSANPRMDSTRVFVLFLWLYTMILTIAYSSNLTAFLLVQKAPSSIQTLEDLYGSGLEVAGFAALDRDTSEVGYNN